LYKHHPTLVLGFHACERKIGEGLVRGSLDFKASENDHDWLGHGMYFWESSPDRAKNYGNELKEKRKTLVDPIVVGAAIHLGYCFDLLDYHSLTVLKGHYDGLSKTMEAAEVGLPANSGGSDNLMRKLDCAVFEYMHSEMSRRNEKTFDSVRGVFWEGNELYPNAGFKDKNHIQLCIRNPNCIKGFFLPRSLDGEWDRA